MALSTVMVSSGSASMTRSTKSIWAFVISASFPPHFEGVGAKLVAEILDHAALVLDQALFENHRFVAGPFISDFVVHTSPFRKIKITDGNGAFICAVPNFRRPRRNRTSARGAYRWNQSVSVRDGKR